MIRKTIEFGNYPQSEVKDESILKELNNKIDALPNEQSNNGWHQYNYIIMSKKEKYMFYIDISLGNDKYRGVYFIKYRPFMTRYVSMHENGFQKSNGYSINTIYWFKYEPIEWEILENDKNEQFIFSSKILDSQDFGVISNNYEFSKVRKFLNEDFLNTAFNDEEKKKILDTKVDNSPESTLVLENENACNDTVDKVFLLSAQEVTNTKFGFEKDCVKSDVNRIKISTPYAQIQGCDKINEITWFCKNDTEKTNVSDFGKYAQKVIIPETNKIIRYVYIPGNASWLLRSPDSINNVIHKTNTENKTTELFDKTVMFVDMKGIMLDTVFIENTSVGIVPAIKIKVSK
ncbi:MAG: DUF6273 domain-containing protein [Clostridia bacterium]|nr:DUF6273 domain-containing protein [Clostridia bacterium]